MAMAPARLPCIIFLVWPVLAASVSIPGPWNEMVSGDDGGCDTMCDFEGRQATCSSRILWAADNLYSALVDRGFACESALKLVQQQCHNCPMCMVPETPCWKESKQGAANFDGGEPEAIATGLGAVLYPEDEPPMIPTPSPKVASERMTTETKTATATTTFTTTVTSRTATSTTVTMTVTETATVTVTMPPRAAVAESMPFIPVEPAVPCDTVCLHTDHLATCTDRILWAATQDFEHEEHACERAHSLVLEQCPDTCGRCLFKDVVCKAATPRFQLDYECAAEPESIWSAEKRKWCCERNGVGCTTTTAAPLDGAAVAAAAEGHGSRSSRSSRSGRSSSNASSAPAFQCHGGHAAWESWSEEHKVWCFTHEELFSRLYTCEDNGLLWKTEWADSKKAWCCYFDATWRDDKQEWCCLNEGRLCDKVYGTPSGVSKFQLLKFIDMVDTKTVTVGAIILTVAGVFITLVIRRHGAPPDEALEALSPKGATVSPTSAYKVLHREQTDGSQGSQCIQFRRASSKTPLTREVGVRDLGMAVAEV